MEKIKFWLKIFVMVDSRKFLWKTFFFRKFLNIFKKFLYTYAIIIRDPNRQICIGNIPKFFEFVGSKFWEFTRNVTKTFFFLVNPNKIKLIIVTYRIGHHACFLKFKIGFLNILSIYLITLKITISIIHAI